MGEELAMNDLARGRDDEIALSAQYLRQQRKWTATTTRLVRPDANVACFIANKRHDEVGQIGDHYAPRDSGAHRIAPVVHNLDEAAQRIYMQAAVLPTLGRQIVNFARAVKVVNRGLEGGLNNFPLARGQHFGSRFHCMRPDLQVRPRQKKSRKYFQSGSVANNKARFPARQHDREFFQLVFSESECVTHAQLLYTLMAPLFPSAQPQVA